MSETSKIKDPILPAEDTAVRNDKRIRSMMMWVSIVLAVIVIGSIAYIYGYRQPAIASGNEQIAKADAALFAGNDSLALELYEAVAANSSFAAGERAKLQAAIILFDQEEYEKALKYLDGCSFDDDVVSALALQHKGNCLVNLDRLPEAIKAFDQAIAKADENPLLVPFFLEKKATVYEAQKDYKHAAETYKRIETEYPNYAMQIGAEGLRLQMESMD